MEHNTRNARLMRQREEHLARQAALQQEKAAMIKATAARSPAKKPASKNNSPVKNNKTKSSPARRPGGGAATAQPEDNNTRNSIAAYRPESPEPGTATPEHAGRGAAGSPVPMDTVGRAIDNAIASSVAGLLQTPPGVHNDRKLATALDMDTLTGVEQPGPKTDTTPAFMTAKNKATYCELDDPEHALAYHRGRRQHKNIFQKLFSCFSNAPPSPIHRRPLSAGSVPTMTPTLPSLTYDIAPLRQGSATLAVPEPPTPLAPADVDALRQSLARSVAEAVAANPPTPRFGGMPDLDAERYNEEASQEEEDNENGVYAQQQQKQLFMADRYATDEMMYPSSQQQHQAQDGLQPMNYHAFDPMGPVAPPMRQNQPPQLQPARRHPSNMQSSGAATVAPMTDAQLYAQQHQRRMQQTQPQPHQQRQRMVAKPAGHDGIAPTPASLHNALAAAGIQNSNAAVASSAGSNKSVATRKHSSAPTSPAKRQPRTKQPAAMQARQQAAPHAPSPLKKPSIEPRMTKAAVSRNQANARRIEADKKKDAGHWTNLPAAAMLSKNSPLKHAAPAQQRQQQQAQQPGYAVKHAVAQQQQPQQRSRVVVRPQQQQQPMKTSHFSIQPPSNAPKMNMKMPTKYRSCPSSPSGTRDLDFNMTKKQYLQMLEKMELTEDGYYPPGPDVRVSQVVYEANARALEVLSQSDDSNGAVVYQTVNPEARRKLVLEAERQNQAAPEMVASQRMVSMTEAAAVAQMRQSAESVSESGGDAASVKGRLNNAGSLLDQLLSMERSLTLEDLEQLKKTFRKEPSE